MDISKADFSTIVKMGTVADFKEKINKEGKSLRDVVNDVDQYGISLLEQALIYRKFDFAKYFLDAEVKVNVISKTGSNEFHYIAANINVSTAIDIANILLEKDVDLSLKEIKYGNTALFSLCMEVLKKRTPEGIAFIVNCLKKKPDVDQMNKAGYSTRLLIVERGTDEMKKALEELQ